MNDLCNFVKCIRSTLKLVSAPRRLSAMRDTTPLIQLAYVVFHSFCGARTAKLLKGAEWWAEHDSNMRRRKPADLQSAPVDRFGIDPCLIYKKWANTPIYITKII